MPCSAASGRSAGQTCGRAVGDFGSVLARSGCFSTIQSGMPDIAAQMTVAGMMFINNQLTLAPPFPADAFASDKYRFASALLKRL
jgi:hypothetical protein